MADYEAYLDDLANDDYRDLPLCEICGTELVKICEKGEAWGSPYIHEYWMCPKCDD
jgi:hypothetical protein